jgi:hypothetical protein
MRRWSARYARPSCFDSGAFSEWIAAMKRGEPWFIREDWTPYFDWVEPRLDRPGRWAVIPDAPGAPSQLNDSLLNMRQWDPVKWAPLWHMDAPIERLIGLCERFERVCLGWTGTGADAEVGCEAWWRRMDEVAAALGNRWPNLHHMRGVLVAREFPFTSADATSGAQNGSRYDFKLGDVGDRWAGRRAYLDRLERGDFPIRVRSKVSRAREAARRPCPAPGHGQPVERSPAQLGLL